MAQAVEVVRSGGFAGVRKQGTLDLDSDDPRAPQARELVSRIDFTAAPPSDEPRPDGFTYHFRCRGTECAVPEHALTDDQRHLARLVLDD